MSTAPFDETLARELEDDLVRHFGMTLGSAALASTLGYPSMRAYHQAVARQTIPVPTFQVEHRRGRFALAKDVARWLAQQRPKSDPAVTPVVEALR